MNQYDFSTDPEESDWKLSTERKAAIEKAANDLKNLLNRNPPPNYTETIRAAEEISAAIDTSRY